MSRKKELTVEQVLIWADDHYARTGCWPRLRSGPVVGTRGVSWHNIESALRRGYRGLPGGDTLARLLARERGARNPAAVPPLAVWQILCWADAHRRLTGRWPNASTGPVPGTPGETWMGIQTALYLGHRGLPGGSSLSRLLAEYGRRALG